MLGFAVLAGLDLHDIYDLAFTFEGFRSIGKIGHSGVGCRALRGGCGFGEVWDFS